MKGSSDRAVVSAARLVASQACLSSSIIMPSALSSFILHSLGLQVHRVVRQESGRGWRVSGTEYTPPSSSSHQQSSVPPFRAEGGRSFLGGYPLCRCVLDAPEFQQSSECTSGHVSSLARSLIGCRAVRRRGSTLLCRWHRPTLSVSTQTKCLTGGWVGSMVGTSGTMSLARE